MLEQRKSPERPRATEEQVERIHDAFENSRRKSTHRANCQLEIPCTTIWRVLKRRLHMKPYKLRFVQALTNDNREMQITFCE